jgi:streptomycin 6-kinase
MTELPDGIRAMAARGPAWARWVDDLDSLTGSQLAQWELRPDGTAAHGSGALILPVRSPEGSAAILKIGFPDAESEQEHLVLRRWGGQGAVRLLRADPHHRAVLLERLRPQNLTTLPDLEACEIIAGLYRRLQIPALPQLPSLTSYVEQWSDDLRTMSRNAPIPHRLVEQAITLGRELTADTSGSTVPGSVLHGDLHYESVLAADREPWLAIAPKPLNGDPHYELAPLLWHRWDELAGHIRDGVRARFHTLVNVAGLDEERARAWVVVRVVHEATRELERGSRADTTMLTKYVALAKAVQN